MACSALCRKEAASVEISGNTDIPQVIVISQTVLAGVASVMASTIRLQQLQASSISVPAFKIRNSSAPKRKPMSFDEISWRMTCAKRWIRLSLSCAPYNSLYSLKSSISSTISVDGFWCWHTWSIHSNACLRLYKEVRSSVIDARYAFWYRLALRSA